MDAHRVWSGRIARVAILLLPTSLLLSSFHVFAEVPHLIRYQGQAVDAQGVPLEGPYTLTFRLYDAETAGTKFWEEIQANVPLTGGHFSVLLGSVTSLSSIDWTQPLWLSLQVNTDPELAPRQQLTSVPLALTAERLAVPVTTSTITDDAHSLVPSGAMILWDGAVCPTGYARVSTLDGKFLVGGSTFNAAAGGTDTLNLAHNHGGATGSTALTLDQIPPHTHGLRGHNSAGGPGPNWFPNLSDPVYTTTESAGGGQGHTHTISNDLGSVENRPAFATVLLCKKD